MTIKSRYPEAYDYMFTYFKNNNEFPHNNYVAKVFHMSKREITMIKDRIKTIKYISKRHYHQRMIIINEYGGKCTCCGESNSYFLCFDHVNNDGKEHRQELKEIGTNIVQWIIENNYPDNIQLLCYNCNMAKAHHGGICPHKMVGSKWYLKVPKPRPATLKERHIEAYTFIEDVYIKTGKFPTYSKTVKQFSMSPSTVAAIIKEIRNG